MGDSRHQIGLVAERLGLSIRTVRYYEEEGLVEPSARSEGGFRLYSDADIERLELIKRMKPLGFTVQEMRDLLDARDRLAELPDDEEALARLSELAGMADQKTEKLRGQLETAEEFAQGLRRDLRRHRRKATAKRSGVA
jgi:DNA-binding transcriptional MerR regulator